MVRYYVYVTGNKITHAEITDLEILSQEYHCLYHGTEENLPNFLPKGVKTEKGGFNYALIDGKVVERSAEEIAADEEAANPVQDTPTGDTDSSVWDELDTAYQEGYQEGYTEGVNTAYDQ